MSDLISRQALCEYALNQKDKSVTPNDIMRFPSAQPVAKDINVPVKDCISRQAAIDSICRTVCDNPEICESPCDEIKVLEIMPSAQPDVPDTNVGDIISRQAAITLPVMPKEHREYQTHNLDDAYEQGWNDLQKCIESLPSAQPEQLTDKEQRIFLAAMGREEKVCKQVDDECRNCREPYEDSLVKTCHEITRKVKGALWEN